MDLHENAVREVGIAVVDLDHVLHHVAHALQGERGGNGLGLNEIIFGDIEMP